jgi:hypothetical protein
LARAGQPRYDAVSAAARLLYDGPWVAERYAVGPLITQQPEAVLPVIREVLAKAPDTDAGPHSAQCTSCKPGAV